MTDKIKRLLHAILNAGSIANNLSFSRRRHDPACDFVILSTLQITLRLSALSDLRSHTPVKNRARTLNLVLLSSSALFEEARWSWTKDQEINKVERTQAFQATVEQRLPQTGSEQKQASKRPSLFLPCQSEPPNI